MDTTTGAPKIAVTVLMDSSVGEKRLLAIRSLKRQNALPIRKDAGMITLGLPDLKSSLATCGIAIPTKDTGPAKAVTVAERILDNIISAVLKALTFMPRVVA